MRCDLAAPIVARHQQHEFADIGGVVLGRLVEKPLDEAGIGCRAAGGRGSSRRESRACPFAWICGIQLGAWLFLSPGVEPNSIRLRTRSAGSSPVADRDSRPPNCRRYAPGAAEMVEQFDDIAHQPFERQRRVGRRHLRAAVAAQIEPHDPVVAAEMRDPGEIAPRAAHRGVQQQQRRRLLPRVGEIVDVIGERCPSLAVKFSASVIGPSLFPSIHLRSS